MRSLASLPAEVRLNIYKYCAADMGISLELEVMPQCGRHKPSRSKKAASYHKGPYIVQHPRLDKDLKYEHHSSNNAGISNPADNYSGILGASRLLRAESAPVLGRDMRLKLFFGMSICHRCKISGSFSDLISEPWKSLLRQIWLTGAQLWLMPRTRTILSAGFSSLRKITIFEPGPIFGFGQSHRVNALPLINVDLNILSQKGHQSCVENFQPLLERVSGGETELTNVQWEFILGVGLLEVKLHTNRIPGIAAIGRAVTTRTPDGTIQHVVQPSSEYRLLRGRVEQGEPFEWVGMTF